MEVRYKFGLGKKRSFQDVKCYQNFHHLANNAVFPIDSNQKEHVRHFHTKHRSITEIEDLKPTIREVNSLNHFTKFQTIQTSHQEMLPQTPIIDQ